MALFSFASTSVSGSSGGRTIDPDQPLVVLVHGAGMDRTVWSLQTRWLAHHGHNALAVDLPGHGDSAEPERASIEDYGEWLTELIGAADRPVHVVGHSMGTFIALEAAVSAAVASLTLVGIAAAMPVHPALIAAAEANDPLAAQLMSGWAFAHETRSGAHPSPGSSMVGGSQAMIERSAPGVLHRDLSMCAAYQSAAETAAQVNAPTTLLLGQADRMTPVRGAQPIIDAIRDCRVEIVPGVGHMIQTEAPRVTRQVIADTVAAAGAATMAG